MVHAAINKERQTTMQTKTNRKSGFTLVEIMIVVAIIGLLAAIAIPNFVKARQTAQANTCVANLKQIDGAKEQWALETKQLPSANATFAVLVGTDAYIKNTPTCPTGGAYAPGLVNVLPTCSIATSTTPAHILPQ